MQEIKKLFSRILTQEQKNLDLLKKLRVFAVNKDHYACDMK